MTGPAMSARCATRPSARSSWPRAIITASRISRCRAGHVAKACRCPSFAPVGEDLNLDRAERQIVERALVKHAYNISLAAAELGLTRTSLYRRMEKHGL